MYPCPIKVLLVEDDEEDFFITRHLLNQIKQTKFELDWAATFQSALEMIESRQHHVYLVDYRLGQHDGLELLQTAVLKGCKAPIILLTGCPDEDLDLAAMKAGVADYLVKGQIDASLLERSIRYSIERHRILEALYESESRLEGILNSLKDMVWSVSATTFEVLYMSPAVYSVYGRAATEFFENKNLWLEVIHPDDQAWVKQASQAVLEIGSKDIEYRILQPNGSVRWIHDRAYLVCDTAEKAIRMDGITSDITTRKQAEEAFRQAMQENNRLAAAISNLSTGVVISDPTLPDNPIISVNAGFTHMTGYTAEEVIGRNCRFLQGKETDQTTVSQLRQAIQQRRPFTNTLLNYRKDGTPFWNELTVNPVFDQEGRLIHFVGLQTDVTARKRAEDALIQLQHRNELILNSAGEGIYGLDVEGRITFMNLVAARMLGWDSHDLIGQRTPGLIHTCQTHGVLCWKEPLGEDTNSGSFVHNRGEEVFWRRDGSSFLVEYISTPILENQRLVGTVVTFQDVTVRRQAEAALRESEERYAIAVQGANDGLWDWNLKTNQIYFSPRWKSILGYEDKEISNSVDEWFGRIHFDDLELVKEQLTAHLKGLIEHFECEYRMLHQNGLYRWVLCRGLAVQGDDGKVSRIAGSLSDITSRKQAETQLLHSVLHDSLTDLPNQALLMNRLERALERSKHHDDYLFAVLFLDIDRFKLVNDTLGHIIGNQLLIAIAQRLTTCVSTEDTVARMGGDEFVVLLENVEATHDVTRVAERICHELAQPFYLEKHKIFTSASIGIAFSSTNYQRPEYILRDADITMYRAKSTYRDKSAGASRYELFDASMNIRAIERMHLETDLRNALERQEFILHYQPIVSLKTEKLVGFEALIRWQHPERGLVSPTEFIPIAEETGLITDISWWVLQQACQQMQCWKQQFPTLFPLNINVNLSGKQISQANVVLQVQQILQETGFNAGNLKIEITESSVMEKPEATIPLLHALKALGVQLAVDDFGTGYSSLSYLYRFPIDTLKIDRSFINRIDIELEKLELVRTISMLAWNFGMDIVAEGVETQKQLAQLKMIGCDSAQGYLFSKPLDPVMAQWFLREQALLRYQS